MTKYYKNYIFDLYGTLADIHTDEESDEFWQSFKAELVRFGVRAPAGLLRDYYRGRVRTLEAAAAANTPDGVPEIDLLPVFVGFLTLNGATADEQTARALGERFRLLSLRKLRLFEGAAELLTELRAKGRRVYLLSNAQAIFTRPELEKLGLAHRFDGIMLSSDAGRKKPDPAFFTALLCRYGLDAAESVMVGNDDVSDCRGAAAAGLDSLYIETEQSPKRERPLPENCREIERIAAVAETLVP